MLNPLPPVITVDGPSGSGKGTVSQLLARKLGWHYLDSGAIYRVLAFAALADAVGFQDEHALADLAEHLPLSFVAKEECYRLFLGAEDVTEKIRTEECSRGASLVSAFGLVRQALLERQRAFRQFPGLVTDGRDMGTVVFPDAYIKIFLTASAQERAERRYQQLHKMGINASIGAILSEIEQRDVRDQTRLIAPLKPAADAICIDTSGLTVNQVMHQLLAIVAQIKVR